MVSVYNLTLLVKFCHAYLPAEKEIVPIFKAAGDYPGCLASRRIQDNISDLQAQAAANAVGGKLPMQPYRKIYLLIIHVIIAVQIEDLFEEFGGKVVIVGHVQFSPWRAPAEWKSRLI